MDRRPNVLLLAYWLLGVGVLVGNGMREGLPYVLASTALLAVVAARGPRLVPSSLPWLAVLAGVLACRRPVAHGDVALAIDALGALQAAAAVIALRCPRFNARAAIPVLVAAYAASGALLIARGPDPRIDVFSLQQGGARALEAGHNPYAAVYPNDLYTKAETRAFFGDQRTELCDYPYPPLSLLATTAGHWAGGDVRWVLLAAQIGTALLLFALARQAGHPERYAIVLAAFHLLHPRGLFVLHRSWTEPLLTCAFVAVLWLARRRSTHRLGAALGLFVAAKQYSVIALPLLVRARLAPRRAWVDALAVAAAVTVPFFVWSPHDFVHDLIFFQLRQPFRTDALSIPGYVARATGWRAPAFVSFAAAAGTLAWLWPRVGPSSAPVRLAAAEALVYAVFFVSEGRAFCNYYYFVGVAILAAAALQPPAPAPVQS